MRAVIQLVTEASVRVNDCVVGQCGRGYLILLGIGEGDTSDDARRLVRKIIKLRVFPDERGKMNRSIVDIGGEILLISQFTLYANVTHGNRPDFLAAAKPPAAISLYETVATMLREDIPHVQTGQFGAHMQVTLTNDGPVTIVIDSAELFSYGSAAMLS